MEKVAAYRSNDGQLFCDEKSCNEHEERLRLLNKYGEAISGFMVSDCNIHFSVDESDTCKRAILSWERFKEIRYGKSL